MSLSFYVGRKKRLVDPSKLTEFSIEHNHKELDMFYLETHNINYKRKFPIWQNDISFIDRM